MGRLQRIQRCPVNGRGTISLPKSLMPFPNIQQRRPELLRKAMAAYNAYRRDRFAKTYFELRSAARNASLSLDGANNLHFWVPKQNLVRMFAGSASGMAMRSVLGRIPASMGVDVMKHVGPLLGIATLLLKVFRGTQNEGLVGGVGKEWNDKRFRKKLSMIMVIYAKAHRVEVSGVRRRYVRFEKQLKEVSYYQSLENSLNPSYRRRGPEVRAAP